MRRDMRNLEARKSASGPGGRSARFRPVILLLFLAAIVVQAFAAARYETPPAAGVAEATAAVNCATRDPANTGGGTERHDCITGQCCLAHGGGFDAPDLIWANLEAATPGAPTMALRHGFAARGTGGAIAGWATSWSSRAPPRGA
jgi:hypothetical protein